MTEGSDEPQVAVFPQIHGMEHRTAQPSMVYLAVDKEEFEAYQANRWADYDEGDIEAAARGMEDLLVQLAIGTDPEDEAGPTIEYARTLARGALAGVSRKRLWTPTA